jgi:hypothetical protein
VIPLSERGIEVIRQHVNRYPPRPYTLPWEKAGGKPHTCMLLFRWPSDDQHVKARSYSETVWKPAAVNAGVIPAPERDKRGRVRYVTTRKEGIHQLRHYYASVCSPEASPLRNCPSTSGMLTLLLPLGSTPICSRHLMTAPGPSSTSGSPACTPIRHP